MGLVSEHVKLGNRWPFVLFVAILALVFLACVLLFPTMPHVVRFFCLFIFAAEWGGALKARAVAVDLLHPLRVMYLSVFVAAVVCTLLFESSSMGRLLTPGLFFLVNLPLVILKEKPNVQDQASR